MIIRNKIIRIIQELVLLFSKKKKKVVIVFVPGKEFFSGGVLALFYLYRQTIKILDSSDTACFVCSLPYDHNVLRYKNSGQGIMLFNYFAVLRKYRKAGNIMLQVTESFVWEVAKLSRDERQKAIDPANVHINILNMNMELMPPPEEVEKLRQMCHTLTITAAHPRYTRKEFTEPYGMDFSYLCAWITETEMLPVPFSEKKDMLLVGRDPHAKKEWILDKVRHDFPEIEIINMPKMKFEDYLELQRKVKWTITFGEGIDGYFNNSAFTGGVGLTVYNSVFFTEDFYGLPNVFNSFEDEHDHISTFIKKYNNAAEYTKLNAENLKIIRKYWSPELTTQQLKVLYRDKHGFSLRGE